MRLANLPKKAKVSLLMLLVIVITLPLGLWAIKRYQSLNSGASVGASTLSFSPGSQTSQVGVNGNYNVFVSPNNETVTGVEFWLTYNPAVVNVTDVVPGPFFTNPAGSIGQPVEIVKTIANGQIHYAIGFPLGSNFSSTTANTAAIIKYTGIATGTSNFVFLMSSPKLTLNSNISASNVLGGVTNGSIVITGGTISPTPTPTRSPSPTPTRSPSPTPTRSPSPTPTRSPSPTPSRSPSPSPTSAGKTPTPSPTATASPMVIPGDVNRDGSVDIIDIGIVIDNYNRLPITNPSADINSDGSVDIIDIGIIIDHYGETN